MERYEITDKLIFLAAGDAQPERNLVVLYTSADVDAGLLPELSWAYGYPAVIALSSLSILICLWIFKKKKFL